MRKKEKMILVMALSISVILITSIFFYNKYLTHKNEIKLLLKAEDISKSNSNNKVDSYSLINEYDKRDITKKDSKDFITTLSEVEGSMDIENKQQDAEAQEVNYKSDNVDDVILLAKLINSEAGDEPFEGKIAVANVVLYRTRENEKSIKDIVFASGQFDGVQTKLFNDNPSSESLTAARQALSGKKVLDKAYYFANLKLCNPSWASEKNFVCRIGDHWFFKE